MKHLVVLLTLCLLSPPVGAQYGGGTGRPDDPYLIYTAEQMNNIGVNRNDWDKHFKLMADIDLSQYTGEAFNIIGTGANSAFQGIFDGNGKKISNFTTTKRDYTGMFGYVDSSNAEIKNLGLINPNIRGEGADNVGSLMGYLDEGTITNCYAEGGRVVGGECIGGLVGYNKSGRIMACHATCSVSGDEEVGGLLGQSRGTVDNCYTGGTVSGDRYIGGLVGRSYSGSITHSMTTGKVSGEESHIGGLAGSNSGSVAKCSAWGDVFGDRTAGGLVGNNSGPVTCSYASGSVSAESYVGGLVGNNTDTIRNCYAEGSVSGEGVVGGLVGKNTWPGKIDDCYSVGGVAGTTYIGGLVGYNDEAVVRTSFWDVRTSGRNNMCGREQYSTGCDDTKGKTTIEMRIENTFLNAGWDFVAEKTNGTDDIWSICQGLSYPQFAWQFRMGDFDGDTQVDFTDFAVFAERWLSNDSNFFFCRGADLTDDGKVDFHDLNEFTRYWLAESIGTLRENSYLIIDDFESYNDLDPNDPQSNRIFNTWLDGLSNPSANGAVVGYFYPPLAERTIVHSGKQSMPYSYNIFFKFSKAELTLSPPQDWTQKGDGVLSLWFYGDKSNAPAPMGVALNGSSTVYHDNPQAVQIDAWTEWTIDLQAFAGVDLANVYSIAICFGDQNNPQPGGFGKVLFDDIRLYWPG